MFFAFTEEQEDFRASLRRLLTDRAPSSRVRETFDAGCDPSLWKLLTEDMGLPGLHVPEELGGQGFGYLETAVVFAELGRCLAPVPMAATTFAMEAILRCGSPEQRQRLIPDLADGSRTGALGLSSGADIPDTGLPADTPVAVSGTADEVVLHGTVRHVLHGAAADRLVLPAADPGSSDAALHVVDVDAPGVTVAAADSLDLTRPVATVILEGAAGERLTAGTGTEGIHQALDVARTLLAFESIGAAERCLELSVEYATSRVQFNRPIGSFQSIKHRCADMAIEIDATRGAAMYAAMVLDQDPIEFARTAPLAKAQAAETLRQCAHGMIQVHGGIGFTWEHDSHLYYRRATANEVLLGDVEELREIAADRAGI